MRVAGIVAVLALTGLVLGSATYYKLSRSSPVEVPPTQENRVVATLDPAPNSAVPNRPGPSTPPDAVPPQPTPGEHGMIQAGATPELSHSNYVARRTAELMDLSMENDTQSLQTILSELNNRDPAVRGAAREAAIQFGSRDAIPSLLEAAAQTDDPKEKQALNEAAEFLKLPSLTEVRAAGGFKPVTVRAKPLRKMSRPPPAAKVTPVPDGRGAQQ